MRGAEQEQARRLGWALMREPGGWGEEVAEGTYGNLRADVGLDAGFLSLGVEAGCAVDAVAVGEGEPGHVELGSALDEGFGLGGSSEKAEGAGGVEFDVGH